LSYNSEYRRWPILEYKSLLPRNVLTIKTS